MKHINLRNATVLLCVTSLFLASCTLSRHRKVEPGDYQVNGFIDGNTYQVIYRVEPDEKGSLVSERESAYMRMKEEGQEEALESFHHHIVSMWESSFPVIAADHRNRSAFMKKVEKFRPRSYIVFIYYDDSNSLVSGIRFHRSGLQKEVDRLMAPGKNDRNSKITE